MFDNIVLVGFMGSGKTLIGGLLAKRLDRAVVSTDLLVEAREGRSISEIFRDSGEACFRRREAQVVEDVAQKRGIIIDCGGGVVLNPHSIEKLRANGKLFYLHSGAEAIYERLRGNLNRPLLQTADPLGRIRELLREREPLYRQADYVIETDGLSHDEICDAILDRYYGHVSGEELL